MTVNLTFISAVAKSGFSELFDLTMTAAVYRKIVYQTVADDRKYDAQPLTWHSARSRPVRFYCFDLLQFLPLRTQAEYRFRIDHRSSLEALFFPCMSKK